MNKGIKVPHKISLTKFLGLNSPSDRRLCTRKDLMTTFSDSVELKDKRARERVRSEIGSWKLQQQSQHLTSQIVGLIQFRKWMF